MNDTAIVELDVQLDLALAAKPTESTAHNPQPLIDLLTGQDWMTSAQILESMGRPVNESGKRMLRHMADNSKGQIAGGQLGYKLVREMTREEYDHFRNWMTKQADNMRHRIIEADKVWFTRKPI